MPIDNVIAELRLELASLDIAVAILDEYIGGTAGQLSSSVTKNLHVVFRTEDSTSHPVPQTSTLRLPTTSQRESEYSDAAEDFLVRTHYYQAWRNARSAQMADRVRQILKAHYE